MIRKYANKVPLQIVTKVFWSVDNNGKELFDFDLMREEFEDDLRKLGVEQKWKSQMSSKN